MVWRTEIITVYFILEPMMNEKISVRRFGAFSMQMKVLNAIIL